MHPIDLRSDTVTTPTAAMRQAIADAEVGDDVLGDDPTVNALQARCAEWAGKPAALFVPSGTMANLVACRLHTSPGDEVILDRGSHLYRYEAGGFAVVAGCSVALVDARAGLLDAALVDAALRPDDVHQPRSRLLWLENTHNFGGGSCYDLEQLAALRGLADARGLSLHIDGARVFNACVAQGYALSAVAQRADSMSFCFSKGLGCPVGSMLVGEADFIERARRVRKMLGGGMRQAGVLAAAALHALDHHVERLADDHRRARVLADALGRWPGLSVSVPETNLVFADTGGCHFDAPALAAALADEGIRVLCPTPLRLRFVTHLDVDDADLSRVVGELDRLRQDARFAG